MATIGWMRPGIPTGWPGWLLGLVLLAAWPSATAGERVEVELVNGDRIAGELLRRNADFVLLLVGDELVRLAADRVKRLGVLGEPGAGPELVRESKLYATARRPVRDMQSLVEELGPAIAVVKTPSGLGTGWFCSPDGHLVTNHHVVAGERTIRVTVFPRQGKTLGHKVFRKVRIVALNAEMDLALLKIEEPLGMELPRLYLGDSREIKVGDRAFAIGNPLGLERSTSQGIVSKVGRNIGGRLFLQTTAPIAPGNSGGPLFNQRGEVIGVVSRGAILLDGLGFAIPSEYLKEFLDNVEAFAYDEDNPNSGVAYMEAPVSSTDGKIRFDVAEFVRVGHGLCCLNVSDLDGDGAAELVFADNNKSEIGILRRRTKSDKRRAERDVWDINRLPDSQRFQLDSIPVTSRVSSIAVGDVDGDLKPDLVFHGDLDGLSMLPGNGKGAFGPVRKIDDVPIAGLEQAIRIADLDGDRALDVFVLGQDVFTIFWSGRQRSEYPLELDLRSKVRQFEFVASESGKLRDLVFFANSGRYGAHLRLQIAPRRFDQGQPLRSQVSGPVRLLGDKGGHRFVTLDLGINRIRALQLDSSRDADGSVDLHSLAIESGQGAGAPVDLLDVDGDGRLEALTADSRRGEFVFFEHTARGFEQVRSPAPASPLAFRLHRTRSGQAVAFCFSRGDHLLGVGRLAAGRVTFPQPIHTQGQVQWMQLERLPGPGGSGADQTSLVWAERSGGGELIRLAPADALARAAHDQEQGSLDATVTTLTFGPDEKRQQARLDGKTKRLAFADFNADGRLDLVVFWAYSDKESLYLGLGGGRFQEVDKQQRLIDDEGRQALMVEDLDGDGRAEVLQVQPGCVREMRVDSKGRLYIHRQWNWEFGTIDKLAPFARDGDGARLVAVAGRQARIVRMSAGREGFEQISSLDLTGIELDGIRAGDLDGDGTTDLVSWSKGTVRLLLGRPARRVLASRIALDAALNHFSYWNLAAADLDRDGTDEVLLFDKLKSVMEILRNHDGDLRTIFRHRLFSDQLAKRTQAQKEAPDQPREVAVGDLDGNRKPDLIFVLHDRLAIYLQADK